MSFSTESRSEIARLRDEIKRGTRIISLNGLTSVAAKAFVLSELKKSTDKTLVIVTDSNEDSDTWECDLDFFQSQTANRKPQIAALPSFESDIYANLSPHAETQEKRALALWNLTKAKPDFLDGFPDRRNSLPDARLRPVVGCGDAGGVPIHGE